MVINGILFRTRAGCPWRDVPPEYGNWKTVYNRHRRWALEMANRTVHGVLHLGWVPDDAGGYRGQMAVLVKPNGLFGTGYMAAIRPFRHLIVYPPMLRQIGRGWQALPGDPAPAHA